MWCRVSKSGRPKPAFALIDRPGSAESIKQINTKLVGALGSPSERGRIIRRVKPSDPLAQQDKLLPSSFPVHACSRRHSHSHLHLPPSTRPRRHTRAPIDWLLFRHTKWDSLPPNNTSPLYWAIVKYAYQDRHLASRQTSGRDKLKHRTTRNKLLSMLLSCENNGDDSLISSSSSEYVFVLLQFGLNFVAMFNIC